MKKVWTIGLLSLLGTMLAQANDAMVKQLRVDDFYKLTVYNNFDITYRQNADSAGIIVLMASAEDLPKIECESKKGKLTIKYKGPCDKTQMQGAIIIYSTALEYIENNGIGLIEVLSPITGSGFKARVIGNGSITVPRLDFAVVEAVVLTGKGTIALGGVCREAELKIDKGAGQIEADNLKARDVTCRISLNGVIGCYATEKLNAWATGRGEVYYRGNPEIKKNSLGELEIRSLEGITL